jgi:thiol-disulfide isomerase/thioredoxin
VLYHYLLDLNCAGSLISVLSFLTRSLFISVMLMLMLLTGCGPCRQIKPIFEELSGKHPDVAFGLVDVDENPDASSEFQVQSIPTFVTFDGETQVERFSGADPTKLETIVKDLEGR